MPGTPVANKTGGHSMRHPAPGSVGEVFQSKVVYIPLSHGAVLRISPEHHTRVFKGVEKHDVYADDLDSMRRWVAAECANACRSYPPSSSAINLPFACRSATSIIRSVIQPKQSVVRFI